ncbi:PAS domain S-box-containing protein [Methanofollis sp. W23]|uniref:CHASE4 domain-containing protein n=1 Tax=Methanofollis sp. W23 TaxID=2817849 RepID=UPI001AE679D2|nr:CHASE4 domain-containing protein [Methanofollis sp. W23]MBP2145167.1 PAS domain S-box-containing protein [Methanofollis sp. W23]
MKLRTHVALVTVLITLSLICGIVLASNYLLLKSLDNVEKTTVERTCDLLESHIDKEVYALGLLAGDYATWDETYYRLSSSESSNLQSLFLNETFISSQVDWLLLFDAEGDMVVHLGFGAENQTSTSQTLLSEATHLNLTRVDEGVEGIVVLQNGPTLVAAAPVLRGSGEGPRAGTLVIGRNLDGEMVQEISDVAMIPVSLVSEGEQTMFSPSHPRSPNTNWTTIRISDDRHTISGILPVSALAGSSEYIIRVDLPRTLYFGGLDAIYSFVLLIIIICSVAGILIILILDHSLISHFRKMTSVVEAVRRDQDYSRRLPAGNMKEMNLLASSVNELFEYLEKYLAERKHYEQTIQESEERYRTLVESANDGICMLDRDRIVDCNSRAAEMLGHRKESMVQTSPCAYAPDQQPDGRDSKEALEAYIALAYEGKTTSFEWQYLTTDGTPVDAEVILGRFELTSGPYLLAIIRDITERKQLEQLKSEAFAQIEQNLRQFAALNDEIRNPLQVIQGLAELDGGENTEKYLRQVAAINDLVDRLDRGYIESDKVREFLRKHYHIGEEE